MAHPYLVSKPTFITPLSRVRTVPCNEAKGLTTNATPIEASLESLILGFRTAFVRRGPAHPWCWCRRQRKYHEMHDQFSAYTSSNAVPVVLSAPLTMAV